MDTGDCTTHFNVVDSDRNVVSCTQTAVSLFGSGIVVPDTGILMNNSMIWFNPRPGYVNSIAAYKRPLVNMSPIIASNNRRPVLALGAPGGRKIISAVLQVLLNIVDFKTSKSGIFYGKTIMFTGGLSKMSRAEAKALVEKEGGKILGTASKKLDYLVVGDSKPTPKKVEKAKQLNIKIIDESNWYGLLNR